jgi:hypothetical protein
MAVKEPDVELIVNAAIDPDVEFVRYRKCPAGSLAIEVGVPPTVYGEPLISARLPFTEETT